MRPSPSLIAAVAAGSLLLGFGVAELTGVRALGGIVLLAGAVWCGLQVRARAAGMALGAVYLAAFAGSHLLADTLGAWPAVALAAAVTGAVAYALASSSSAHIAE